jgi:hypothetical protein
VEDALAEFYRERAIARTKIAERDPGSTAAMTPMSEDALYGASRKTFARSEL